MRYIVLFAAIVFMASDARAQSGSVKRVHDPAIMKADGAYYLFSTSRGISIRQSTDLKNWENIGSVFRELPAWAREQVPGTRDCWAPDISFFNGRYHLYYSISTFGKNRSRIGLVTNVTLDPGHPDYQWVDQGKIVESNFSDDFNAIDPNIYIDETGTPWMSFGSYWGGIMLMKLDPKTGKRADKRMIRLAARPNEKAIEAPFIVRKGEWFHLLVSFDQCCRGVESTYKIMVGRSRSLAGPYRDKQGKPMLDGGGTLVLQSHGHVRGPGHCAVLLEEQGDFLIHHYYDANERGMAKLQIRKLTWDEEGWPVAGEPITDDAPPATQPTQLTP